MLFFSYRSANVQIFNHFKIIAAAKRFSSCFPCGFHYKLIGNGYSVILNEEVKNL